MNYNVESMRHIYAYATEQQREDGRKWYKLALLEAVNMALMYGVQVRTAAGVIAALSPRKTWAHNLRLAHEYLSGARPRTLKASLAAADRVYAGDLCVVPPDYDGDGMLLPSLRGPKTRAFYRAIMGDGDSVVLDVWMLRALGVSSDKLTDRQYAELADVVMAEAQSAGVPPSEYQAIVWCAIRGKSF